MEDLRNIQPFALSTDDVGKYNLKYLGKEKIDDIDCYVFDVAPKTIEKGQRYFQGQIWVDDQDFQIVKTYGKAVPDIKGKGGDVREIGDMVVIDDTYNANPASLRRAVQTAAWLAHRQRRPLVVVVGSMLELGPESARLHAEAAREIAQRKPALVAAVGKFARAFESLREALGGRLITAPDAAALGPKLKSALRGNELVLLKASRGVALERVLNYLT